MGLEPTCPGLRDQSESQLRIQRHFVRVEGFEPPEYLSIGFTVQRHSTIVAVPSSYYFNKMNEPSLFSIPFLIHRISVIALYAG